jgi:hypothetical protein
VGVPEGDGTAWTEAESVLINTSKIDHLETASPEDIGLAQSLDHRAAMDPGAKDMTGAL